MKSFQILILLSVIFLSFQPREKIFQDNNTIQSYKVQQDTFQKNEANKQSLVLTSDALELVDQITGSSMEIPFGTPKDQMIEIVNNILKSEVADFSIKSVCSAGPLKMATWSNGLTLVFQENNTKSAEQKTEWLFEGWYVNRSKESKHKLTTLAGMGIGSTLAEIESAYEIDVKITSLGHEFSTTEGIYGILDGAGKEAKITQLWSGVSCNFR